MQMSWIPELGWERAFLTFWSWIDLNLGWGAKAWARSADWGSGQLSTSSFWCADCHCWIVDLGLYTWCARCWWASVGICVCQTSRWGCRGWAICRSWGGLGRQMPLGSSRVSHCTIQLGVFFALNNRFNKSSFYWKCVSSSTEVIWWP